MSFVSTEPELLSAAAGSLAGIGDSMTAGTTAAAGPTTGVIPPAADLVSALAATHLAVHGELFQAISAQAAAMHQEMVATLGQNAGAYTTAEANNSTFFG